MEFHTVHEFRNKFSDMLRTKVAGVFVPSPGGRLPADLQREDFTVVTAQLSRQRESLGISEEQIAADIDELHRKRRAATVGGRL